MRRLLELTALILVFFVLAFGLGFADVVPTEDGSAIGLGRARITISGEALVILREQAAAFSSLLVALPTFVTEGIRACGEALTEVREVFRLFLLHDGASQEKEGATLV